MRAINLWFGLVSFVKKLSCDNENGSDSFAIASPDAEALERLILL